jgi:hypothetical protein
MLRMTLRLAALLACLSLGNIAIAQVVDPCSFGCPKEGCPKCDKGGPIGAEADTEASAAASAPADAAAEEEAAEEDSGPRRSFGY